MQVIRVIHYAKREMLIKVRRVKQVVMVELGDDNSTKGDTGGGAPVGGTTLLVPTGPNG